MERKFSDTAEKTWDEAVDAVVIGSGYAGLVAAAEAACHCESVLVLEKMPYLGGNSRIAGGGYCCWDSKLKLREKLGLGEDSWRLHYEDTLAAGGSYNFPDLVEVLAKEAPAGLDLLVDAGIPFRDSLPRIGGHSAYRSYQMACTGSEAIEKLVAKCRETGRVEIRKRAEVSAFVEEDGAVRGVEVRFDGAPGSKRIRARRGVIIASGGYARDVELRSAYRPTLTDAFNCTNHKGATGEVIRYAEEVGADVVHMEFVQLYPCADPSTGGIDQGAFLCYSGTGYGLIYVTREGGRFVNELASREEVSSAQMALGEAPTYSILNGSIFSQLGIGADEVEKLVSRGRAIRAGSAEDLANRVGFDPEVFAETVLRHNEAIMVGVDEDFGKPMTSQMSPLVGGEWYAIPQWPSVHYCMGGLRIDTHARVLDIWQRPIPGLYAAGEVCGGVHGIDRLGGNGIAECIVFGRRAGMLSG